MLVSAILDEAAVYLNDSTRSRYTYPVLLPYVKRAFKQLQLELHLNDFSVLQEVSTLIDVDILDTELTLPADLVEPIALAERLKGSSVTFTPMTKTDWEPELEPSDALQYWTWREEKILFIGATSERQVKLRYQKGLTPITNENSSVDVIDADLYMSPYTAGLASKFIGENYARGNELIRDAELNINKIIRRNIRKRQGSTVRRRSFGSYIRGGS